MGSVMTLILKLFRWKDENGNYKSRVFKNNKISEIVNLEFLKIRK